MQDFPINYIKIINESCVQTNIKGENENPVNERPRETGVEIVMICNGIGIKGGSP